jgi:hypothetical protein
MLEILADGEPTKPGQKPRLPDFEFKRHTWSRVVGIMYFLALKMMLMTFSRSISSRRSFPENFVMVSDDTAGDWVVARMVLGRRVKCGKSIQLQVVGWKYSLDRQAYISCYELILVRCRFSK